MQTTQLKSSLAGSAVRPTQRVARQQRVSRTVAAVSADPSHLQIRSARQQNADPAAGGLCPLKWPLMLPDSS